MQAVCDQRGVVIRVNRFQDDFRPAVQRFETLEDEVRKNGLMPVFNRLMRNGNKEKAMELAEKFQR
ncbi:hypothetical protein ACFL08_02435 [Patescibacteria group bacterium]